LDRCESRVVAPDLPQLPPGDKVMQIENDYDIAEPCTGPQRSSQIIGFVADLEPKEGELSVSFDGCLAYGFGELDT
jgi:hypothetical protein